MPPVITSSGRGSSADSPVAHTLTGIPPTSTGTGSIPGCSRRQRSNVSAQRARARLRPGPSTNGNRPMLWYWKAASVSPAFSASSPARIHS